jgi:uncharacterized protein involved in exopolysaccharide biosynthesis
LTRWEIPPDVESKSPNGSGSGEIDLLDLAMVFRKRKRLIFGATLGGCLLSVAVSLLLTPIYRAETSILPPQQSGSGMLGQLMGQLGGLTGLAGAAAGVKNPNELYMGMLQSRTVVDRIIDRFQLMALYDEKYREDCRKKLLKYSEVESDRKSGIITVSVEDKDPKRAAAMANAFVEELRSLTGSLAISEAGQRRLFFKEQLEAAKADLSRAEEGFRGFQERTGALQIDAQAKAVIEGIATLRAQIAAREVQLKVVQTFATPQNPDLQRVEEEVRALKKELARLEGAEGRGPDPLMPTGRMPSVGTEYLRKLRDLKYYETLFEQLAKQYELARIDEARDAAVIQVIDPAVPPEKKFRPKRSVIVVLSTVAAFLLSAILAFLLESAERTAPDPERSRKWEALRRSIP